MLEEDKKSRKPANKVLEMPLSSNKLLNKKVQHIGTKVPRFGFSFSFFIKQPDTLVVLGLYVLVLIVYAPVFSTRDFWDGDWIRLSKPAIEPYAYFSLWNSSYSIGSAETLTVSRIFVEPMRAWLTNLGIDLVVANRATSAWLMIFVAPLSMYLFTRYLFSNKLTAFASALFFVVNTSFVMRTSGGHVLLLYGIALTPLVMYLFLRGINSKRWSWFLGASLVMTIASTYDVRSSLIMIGVISAYFIWLFVFDTRDFRTRFLTFTKAAVCFMLIPVLLLPYYLVPLLNTVSSLQLPSNYDSPFWIRVLSWSKITNTMTYSDPYWYLVVDLGVLQPLQAIFFIFPILAIIGLISRHRNQHLSFFSLVYLVGVFLSKGDNPPFGEVYYWLFANLPGFNGFRESGKFYALIGLGLSILVGVGVNSIVRFAKTLSKKQSYSTILAVGSIVFCLGLFLYAMRPALLHQSEAAFTTYEMPEWQKFIENQQIQGNQFYRTLWLPLSEPISPFSPQNPIISDGSVSLRLLTDLKLGKLNEYYIKNPISLQVFAILGIKYIYISDRDYYNKTFSYGSYRTATSYTMGQQQARQALEQDLKLTPVYIGNSKTVSYEVPKAKDRYFATNSQVSVWGQNDFYNILGNYKNFDLSNVTTFAMDEFLTIAPKSGSLQLLNRVGFEEVMLRFVTQNHLIVPYNALPKVKAQDQVWYKDNLTSRDTWQGADQQGLDNADFDFGKGFVWTNTPGPLNLKATVDKAGAYSVWVRQLESPKAGKAKIVVGDKTLFFEHAATNAAAFHWHKVGALNLPAGSQSLTLEAGEGYNAINLIALVPSDEETAASQKAQEFLSKNQVVQIISLALNDTTKSALLEVSGFQIVRAYKSGQHNLALYVPAGSQPFKITVGQGSAQFTLNIMTDRKTGQTVNLGELTLKLGENKLPVVITGNFSDPSLLVSQGVKLVLTEGSTPLDELLRGDSTPASVSYRMDSPTHYVVKIENATRPFDLVFSEAFDTNWQASLNDGTVVKPEKAYSMLQSYHLEKIGSYEVVVEYMPQRVVGLGLLISGIGLLLVLGLLLLTWWKKW